MVLFQIMTEFSPTTLIVSTVCSIRQWVAIREDWTGMLPLLQQTCSRQTAQQSKENLQSSASHTDLTLDTTRGTCRRRFNLSGADFVHLLCMVRPLRAHLTCRTQRVCRSVLLVDELELVRGAGRGSQIQFNPAHLRPVVLCRLASCRGVCCCGVVLQRSAMQCSSSKQGLPRLSRLQSTPHVQRECQREATEATDAAETRET